jgi:PAS domain S-box-containing protein
MAFEWFRTLADAAPVIIWFAGPDKQSTYFNRRWLDFTGRPIDRELGDGWVDVVHPDDLDEWLGTFRRAFDARQEFVIECRARRYDGTYRWHRNHGTPVHRSDGSFLGYVGGVVDVTDRRQAEHRCEQVVEHAEQTLFAIGLAATGAISASVTPDVTAPSIDALSQVANLAQTGAQRLRETIARTTSADRFARHPRPILLRAVGQFSRGTGRKVELVLSGDDQALNANTLDALCLTVHGALTAMARRSRAESFLVGVHIEPKRMSVCVQDDAGRSVRHLVDV